MEVEKIGQEDMSGKKGRIMAVLGKIEGVEEVKGMVLKEKGRGEDNVRLRFAD